MIGGIRDDPGFAQTSSGGIDGIGPFNRFTVARFDVSAGAWAGHEIGRTAVISRLCQGGGLITEQVLRHCGSFLAWDFIRIAPDGRRERCITRVFRDQAQGWTMHQHPITASSGTGMPSGRLRGGVLLPKTNEAAIEPDQNVSYVPA